MTRTRKERLQLLFQLKTDPQGFEKRAHKAISKLLELKTNPQTFDELDKRAREKALKAREAIFKQNWQFVVRMLEALKPKFIPFPEQVAAAYGWLFPRYGTERYSGIDKEKGRRHVPGERQQDVPTVYTGVSQAWIAAV